MGREARGLGLRPTLTPRLIDAYGNSAERAPGSVSKPAVHSLEKLRGVLRVTGQ